MRIVIITACNMIVLFMSAHVLTTPTRTMTWLIPRFPRRSISLAAGAFIASFAAHGQTTLPQVDVTAGEEHGAHYAPANTTTAAKINAPLRDIPQTVNIVTQEVMRDQGARSVQDVMKGIPSVGLATGDGQRDAIVIRGFTALYDIYLDGVRDDSQYFRDLYNIERVEVLKGPGAALYGRGSSGGLINQVTKKPGFVANGEVGLTTGSYNLKRADFAINRPVSDNLAIRFDSAVEDSGSYRNFQYLKSTSFSPSALWKDGNQSLLVQFNYQHQERGLDIGIPGYKGKPADVPFSTYYGAADPRDLDHGISDMKQTTLQYKLDVSDATNFSNTFRSYRYALDRRHTRIGTVNDLLAIPTVTLSRGSVQRSESGWFNQSEVTHNLKWGGVEHKLLAGAEFSAQSRKQAINNAATNGAAIAAGYAFTTPLFAPVGQNLPFQVPLANSLAPAVGQTLNSTSAYYLQALSSWTPTIKTLIGLRYESYGQVYDDQLPANLDLQHTDRNWSPRAGVVWQPTTAQSYYVSVSKSYQPSGEAGPLATTNADLKPEQTKNIEVGAKYDLFEGAASFNAALYQLTRSDVKYTDPLLAKLINVGQQRANGLELSLAGQVAPGWQVLAGYSLMNARVTKGAGTTTAPFSSALPTPIQDKTLPQAPRHTFSIWTLKSLESMMHGLQAGAGITARSAIYAAIDNAVTLPGYATVDMALYWRPASKGWSGALNFKNVLDRRYAISANNDVGILPGAPRTVELSARYSF